MTSELIKSDHGNMYLDGGIEARIVELETAAKSIKNEQERLRDALLAEMEDKGIIKVETDHVTVTYKAAYDRETLDAKALRRDWPDIYDEHVRITTVRPSVTIKVTA